jgi:hypothetical protein
LPQRREATEQTTNLIRHERFAAAATRPGNYRAEMRVRVAALVAIAAALIVPTLAGGVALSTPEPARSLVRVDIRGTAIASRFPAGRSISFRYPSNWYLTRQRLDVVSDPRTLFAVSSYAILEGPIDACDGTHAPGRPVDGAFVLVKETLDGASLSRSLPRLRTKPRHFQLPKSGRAGCLPPASVQYQFRVAQRAFYVWISIGAKASGKTRAAVARLLDGMWIAPYQTQSA